MIRGRFKNEMGQFLFVFAFFFQNSSEKPMWDA